MSTIKFELNDKNEIISYVKQGGIVGIDLTDFDASKLPDDFFDNYRSGYYMLQNDKVIENPNYAAPEPPEIGSSTIEQQVAALGYQQMQDNQDKQTLVKQNAQMAYQIMQIQQQLGGQNA
ncbi:DUF2977 domain-containing protein [Pediococcus acidilactici]|uniref:DUF2977 domain-containing protein n=1 Tax=Pediococcus acidilactici TaxID=1254 RepID=A0AAW8YQF8_PEDAC|nr:DUF2977 domain-containing protein [Pediococcus acidilactici]MDV2912325.1 DUF2977 domain-containing protein [Pediococcus acidilactici]WQS11414.1 DUF2977 domain-containing protein [Pediococcus acidilactici]WQS18309.1 DUF2977 domain-containing protein [Pediococcus acidilactici]